MALYYPMWTNVTNPVIFFQWVNSLAGGYFGIAIVGGLFAILFLSMKNYDAPRAFASASFTSAIACFLLYLLGLTHLQHVMVFTAMAIMSVFILHKTSGGL